jgi:SOS-response transcriptional repressor LexA
MTPANTRLFVPTGSATRPYPRWRNSPIWSGLSSTASILGLIGRLTEAGYLDRIEGRIAATRRFFARPLVTQVRAGHPEQEPQDETPEALSIDDYLIEDPNRTALVTVRGDSMRNAGLLDGDIAVVETHAPTRSGDIVVAVVDGKLTVKTLRDRGGQFVLEPANPDFKPIKPKGSLEIMGVVIGSFRRSRRRP